ncbi:glycosyltransferase family 2 protein [Desulfogranum marinum]|uniref:glycosyltransferase family 2 protein n=1 Tax=Desulfogranum marinum TaxID=453220 RepID=UPI001963149C|nr:glycosyltransferase family 2 protein [Desulfogranum marinum]MBM9512967.1 glycosyltransferase family 2 protein [Desulfogranum marinum]
MDISLVIPLFNEEENVGLLYDEVSSVLSKMDYQSEIIFIDDGSTDTTLKSLVQIQVGDPRVKVVSLRRNFGQTAAMSAGFDNASGQIIVTMDGDLQNDPNDIPTMIDKLKEGFDVVTGWRYDRKDPFLSRKLPSQIANKIISWVTGVSLHDYGCTLKAFRKTVIRNLNLYGEMHRFIPAIASGMGISFTEVKVNHRARRFGTSKYGITRTIRVVLDLMTVKFLLSYATRPLHVFGTVGVASSFLGFCIAFVMIIQRQFLGVGLANRPLLLMAVLLIFMGVQFITMGLLAELVVRTYHESQRKPIYFVRDIYENSGKIEG